MSANSPSLLRERSLVTALAVLLILGAVSGARAGDVQLPPTINTSDIIQQVRQNRSSGGPQILSGSEFQVGGTPVYREAWADQMTPAVAYDGTNYMVVWQDARTTTFMELGGSDIFGARVTPGGTLLDPVGIMITNDAALESNPAITFDGTNYLVVWEQPGRGWDIWGARVTPGGSVLSPVSFAISQADSDQRDPSVAFNGTRYLVVWEDYRNGSARDVYGSRVTTAGIVQDPAGLGISVHAGDQYAVRVASDGAGWLVVWSDNRNDSAYDIYGARVSDTGIVLDPAGFAVYAGTGGQASPAVAFGSSVDIPPQYSYVVVWSDSRSGSADIYGARVSAAGVVLDPAGVAISTAAGSQGYPDIAFGGMYFLVAWMDFRNNSLNADIYGSRLTLRAGIVVRDPSGIAISLDTDGELHPMVAATSAGFLVVWEDNGIASCLTNWRNVYGARVDNQGVVLDPTAISISESANYQTTPEAAFDGTNYLVVWRDARKLCETDIYCTRVTPAGAVLDATPIAVSTAINDQYDPVVAFDGTNYLVVWCDDRNGGPNEDIYGARVSKAGIVLDPAGIAISTASGHQTNPAIAFDGTYYVVAWTDWRNNPNYDVYACRVTTAGTVLEPSGVAIASGGYNEEYPAVDFDGTNYLFTWMDNRSDTGWDIYGARVNRMLTVLDPGGFMISGAVSDQVCPSVKFDGRNYLAVWQDRRNGTYYDVYGARVTPAASVLDPLGIPISTATEDQWRPRLAFDGEGYLVVWMDDRGAFMTIYGTWVGTDGTVYEPQGLALETGDHDHMWPFVAKGTGNQLLMVYSGFAAPPTYGTFRIWGDFVASASGVDVTKDVPVGGAGFGFRDISPNPFGRETTIGFTLPVECGVSVIVFDVKGTKVATLASGHMLAGRHVALWDGEDQAGTLVPPGIYFCRLAAGDMTDVTKLLVVR